MSNSYFQFKQFRIEQSLCANKVSTDACVFGAFIAPYLKNQRILDVGSGSGLLSLMSAQAGAKKVIGVEIEEKCANLSKENVMNSDYKNIIEIANIDIKDWEGKEKFDWIISNPPFFNNTYPNPNEEKKLARQAISLQACDWRIIIEKAKASKVAFLLSNNEIYETYKSELNAINYTFQQSIFLYDKKDMASKRVILFASEELWEENFESNIIYKNEDGSYTEVMKKLLFPFYLNIITTSK